MLFGYLLLSLNVPSVLWFSRLPKVLQAPPFGLGRVLDLIPINEPAAHAACVVYLLAALLAALGLMTRVSAWIVAITGLYVLGIPEFYGKVNHYHHLLWFSALMAVSPCTDVLSIDALFAAKRRADQGNVDPPVPAIQYALPLRFVWLLMGMVYFFPGFWKLWNGGLDWASPRNMQYRMYQKWTEFPGWTPPFRIDHHPLLLTLCGLGTMLFEMSFIFILFIPRLRLWLVPAGLAFHNMTNLFMRINFLFLQLMYVSLIYWDSVFARLGMWLFPQNLLLEYDGMSQRTRRFVSTLRAFDVLNRILYSEKRLDTARLPEQVFNSDADALNIGVEIGDRKLNGSAASRAVIARVPAIWALLPLLNLALSSSLPTAGAYQDKGKQPGA